MITLNFKLSSLFFVGFILCMSGWQSISASQHSLEQGYNNLGYTSISHARLEAELYYETELTLPTKIPPLNFTYSFGRFHEENDHLEIEYLNPEEHLNYIINVFPAKIGMHVFRGENDSQIVLGEGTHAYFSYSPADKEMKVITLKFEKNNWIYLLSIQENMLTNSLSDLEAIANSL